MTPESLINSNLAVFSSSSIIQKIEPGTKGGNNIDAAMVAGKGLPPLVNVKASASAQQTAAQAQPSNPYPTKEYAEIHAATYKERELDELDATVTHLNEHAQSLARDLLFKVDEDTGKTVVKVIHRETEEIIRQIPPDVVLKLAQRLSEHNEFDTMGLIADEA